MTDFFFFAAVLSWTSNPWFSGFPLPISRDLLPGSPFRRGWTIRATSTCELIFGMLNAVPTWTPKALHLFFLPAPKKEKFVFMLDLAKSFWHVISKFHGDNTSDLVWGQRKWRFGVVFALLLKYGLSLHCSSLSLQGRESLLLAGC